jgi:signal transduction histidine kinase
MRRWFSSLPIHRKLVAMALLVTAAALVLATTGLILLDLWRYRETALDDTEALAEVIAENTAAAVTFNDSAAAAGSLSTVRVRPTIQRACLYLPDGGLFAGFERSSVFVCPPTRPAAVPWQVIAGSAPILRNDRVLGLVYVERDLTEINSRIAVTALTGLGMLLVAGAFAFLLAHRLNRSVSAPIIQLATAARAIQPDADKLVLPDVHAGQDEVGDLVRSFTEMLRRVHEANARLLESNDMLRRQEAEREGLLIREREVSRLKDEFLAAVSHELRTPLNAILGWVQILTTTTVDETTTANALARIARNAKVQARVIDDLIDVSRIVTGKVHLTFDSIDLKDVVKGGVDDIRPTAQAKGIELTIDVPSEPCIVRGDRIRLQQVVWNLPSVLPALQAAFAPHKGETLHILCFGVFEARG